MAVTYFYAADNTLRTSTAYAWTTRGASISGTSLNPNRKYLIVARAVFGYGYSGYGCSLRVQTDDDATIASKSAGSAWPPSGKTGENAYQSYFFVHSYTTDSSPADVRFQLFADGANTARLDQSTLFLLDLDDIGTAGTDYYENIVAATSNYLSNVADTTKLGEISGSNMGTSEHLILASLRATVWNSNKWADFYLKVADDASTQSLVQRHKRNAPDVGGGNQIVVGAAARHKASSGTPNATFYGQAQDTSSYHKEEGGYMIAIPTSVFSDFVHDFTAAAIDVNPEVNAASVSVVPSATGDHLVIGRVENTAGAEAASYTRLHADVSGYGNFPGTDGNYATIPDPSWLAGASDVDVRVRVAVDDWSNVPSEGYFLLSQWPASGGFAFATEIKSTGHMGVGGSGNGTEQVWPGSGSTDLGTVATDGAPIWLRFHYNGGNVDYYYSLEATQDVDAVTWTADGSNTMTLTGGALHNSTGSLNFGVLGTNWGELNGRLFRVQVKVAGTTELDADFTDHSSGVSSFAEDSSNAATVTFQGSATTVAGATRTGDGTVGHTLVRDTTNDLEAAYVLQRHSLTDTATVDLYPSRSTGQNVTNRWLMIMGLAAGPLTRVAQGRAAARGVAVGAAESSTPNRVARGRASARGISVGALVPAPEIPTQELVLPSKATTPNPIAEGYEGAIGDLLVRVAATPSQPAQLETMPVQPPRVDTGINPEDMVPGSGSVFSRNDFQGGNGLLLAHTATSSPADATRYLTSWQTNVVPADPGDHVSYVAPSFQPVMLNEQSGGLGARRANLITLDGGVYHAVGGGLDYMNSVTASTYNPVRLLDEEIVGLTTHSQRPWAPFISPTMVYAATSNGVYTVYGESAEPIALYATGGLAVSGIWSVKARLLVGGAGNALQEIPPIRGGDSTVDWTTIVVGGGEWLEVADAGGYVLAANADGYVYAITYDPSDSSWTVAAQTRIAKDQSILSLAVVGDVVLIGTHDISDITGGSLGTGNIAEAGKNGRLWRAEVDDDGSLHNIQLVREWTKPNVTLEDVVPAAMTTDGRSVYIAAYPHVFRYDAVTGGLHYYMSIKADSDRTYGSKNVASAAIQVVDVGADKEYDRVFVSYAEYGTTTQKLIATKLNQHDVPLFSAGGTITLPWVDFYSAAKKVWLELSVAGAWATAKGIHSAENVFPGGFPPDGALTVEIATTDTALGTTATNYKTVVRLDGTNPNLRASITLDGTNLQASRYAQIRVGLTRGLTGRQSISTNENDTQYVPVLESVSLRAMPTITEQRYRLPVNVSDLVERPYKRPFTVPGLGEAIWNKLKSLEGTAIDFTMYRPSLEMRGIVEHVSTPIRGFTPRGSATEVAVVTIVARDVTFVSTVEAPIVPDEPDTPPPVNAPPTFNQASYSFGAVDEDADVGTVVGTVAATDPENDPFTYELTGVGSANFAVSSDGVITTAVSPLPAGPYSLTAVARSTNQSDAFGTAPVSFSTNAPAEPPPDPPPPVDPPPPDPPGGQTGDLINYGPGFFTTTLNARGAGGDYQLAYPWVAPKSGTITNLAHYWTHSGPGYYAGDGGVQVVSVRKENAQGWPDESTLVAQQILDRPAAPGGAFGCVDGNLTGQPGCYHSLDFFPLQQQGQVTGGERYWVVGQNTHPDHPNNWAGWDCLSDARWWDTSKAMLYYRPNASTPWAPASNSHLGLYYLPQVDNTPPSNWPTGYIDYNETNFVPIYAFRYSDGTISSQAPYAEAGVDTEESRRWGASADIFQTLTVTAGTLREVWLYSIYESGSSVINLYVDGAGPYTMQAERISGYVSGRWMKWTPNVAIASSKKIELKFTSSGVYNLRAQWRWWPSAVEWGGSCGKGTSESGWSIWGSKRPADLPYLAVVEKA